MRCRNRIQKRYPLLPYQDNRIRGGADASTPDVPAQECPSVDILGLHVCSTNVLLLRTTDLHVGTETHSGVNRGNRYEARVKINRRHAQECTSCTFLGSEFSRMTKLAAAWNHRPPCRF